MADKNTIKNWFRTGLKPTQAQFWATWDSFWHKDEKIPVTSIEGFQGLLDEKADAEALTNHVNDLGAHAGLLAKKEDKDQKGVAGGYAPLDKARKIPNEFINFPEPQSVKMVVPVGGFVVFKVAPNTGDNLEIGDIGAGMLADGNFVPFGKYLGGDDQIIDNWNTSPMDFS